MVVHHIMWSAVALLVSIAAPAVAQETWDYVAEEGRAYVFDEGTSLFSVACTDGRLGISLAVAGPDAPATYLPPLALAFRAKGAKRFAFLEVPDPAPAGDDGMYFFTIAGGDAAHGEYVDKTMLPAIAKSSGFEMGVASKADGTWTIAMTVVFDGDGAAKAIKAARGDCH